MTVEDQKVEAEFSSLVVQERETLLEILRYINVIDERKIHAKLGYSSLYDYLMIKHKYTRSAASRRIYAAYALRAVPELELQIEDGSLELTNLAAAQSHMNAQEKASGEKYTPKEKAEIFSKIENQTTDQAQRILFELMPDAKIKHDKKEKVRRVSHEACRLEMQLTDVCAEKLARVKDLLSHARPSATAAEVFEHLLDYYLKKEDPLKKPAAKKSKSQSQDTIPKLTRRAVMQRDQGKCQFVGADGVKCNSTRLIQIDHVMPLAFGGTNDIENLRCACATHNRLYAERNLGKAKANEWRSRV